MIVGISGRKGSGKSTVGMFLMEHFDDAVLVNFGDELKDLCAVAYGAENRSLNGTNEERNAIIPHLGISGRFLMQQLASELRRLWTDCMVYAWACRVQTAMLGFERPPLIVACDVRMPNEVSKIHELGGVVVRLENRAPMDIYSDHSTETALDDCPTIGGRNKIDINRKNAVWFDLAIDNHVLGIDQTNALVLAWVRKQMREAGKSGTQELRDTSEVRPCR